MKNKTGFTLIEIVIVLIIVGILAAIALPNLYSWINKSTAGEALATLSTLKAETEGCLEVNMGNEVNCAALSANFLPTKNYTYSFGSFPPANGYPSAVAGFSGDQVTIVAIPNVQFSFDYDGDTAFAAAGPPAFPGAVVGDYLRLSRSTTGTWTCDGGSALKGVC